MAQLLSGWGRAGWGELAFGEGTIPVNVTAPGAGTTGAPVAGVNAQAIASVPGISASVGSLSVLVDGEANVNPSGQVGTSALGSVSTDCESNVTLVGQELTSSLGVVLVWSRIDENQTPNYTSVTGTQTPSWVEVA